MLALSLRGWRQRQLEERLAAGPAWQDEGLLFTWPDGSFVGPNLPTKWIRELADAIGLPRIRLHDARHSFATLALESGVDVKIVSERLGHANTAITRDVYQHVTPAMDQAAADTVARAIFGNRG